MFKVEVDTLGRTYGVTVRNPDLPISKFGISSSVPVTVRFNDAQEFPGTLAVKIWRK